MYFPDLPARGALPSDYFASAAGGIVSALPCPKWSVPLNISTRTARAANVSPRFHATSYQIQEFGGKLSRKEHVTVYS